LDFIQPDEAICKFEELSELLLSRKFWNSSLVDEILGCYKKISSEKFIWEKTIKKIFMKEKELKFYLSYFSNEGPTPEKIFSNLYDSKLEQSEN